MKGSFQWDAEARALIVRMLPSIVAWLASLALTELSFRAVLGQILSVMRAPTWQNAGVKVAARGADSAMAAMLAEVFGADYPDLVRHPFAPDEYLSRPRGILRTARLHRRYAANTSDIRYGPFGKANTLDVWLDRSRLTSTPAPVLLQIHGGAWTVGSKRGQAHPLMGAMIERGWICVSVNYRKSPLFAWPAHLIDVKRAIAWVRENISEYGGDPEFIVVTGGSAGGHLAALAALTADRPDLQPDFTEADTAVAAAVPFYGVYDLTGATPLQRLMTPFLERFVIKAERAQDPAAFATASPHAAVHRDAPPILIVHGERDSFIPVAQARVFHHALRGVGAQRHGYAELPGAEHAFDTFATVRTRVVVEGVAQYLGIVYGAHLSTRGDRCA